MRKRILVLFSLIFSLILVACAPNNKKLSMDEVIEKAVKNKDKVQSFSKSNLLILSDAKGNMRQYDMKTKEVFNKGTMETGEAITEVKTGNENYTNKTIVAGGFLYKQEKGEKFVRNISGKGHTYHLRPSYFKFLETLLKVKDEFSMEETDTHYILTNKEDSFDFFEKFGDQYNLRSKSGKKETTSKVKISIEKSDFRITSFEFELINSADKSKVTSKTEFTEFDKIKSEEIKEPDAKDVR